MTHYRPPGPLGLGGASIGNLFQAMDDDQARAALDAAWDSGVRHFDTAPYYGFGLSECRMGAALSGRPRDQYVLSTKVGRLLEPVEAPAHERSGFVGGMANAAVFDYSADGAWRSVEASLARLGTGRIDIAYIHDAAEDTHGPAWRDRFSEAMSGAAVALTRMREEGLIRAWGLGVNGVAACLAALDAADPDVFLLAGRYTLLDTSALDTLLPRCADRGVSVVLGGPYNSGLLAAGGTYDYMPASQALVTRRDALAACCKAHGVDLRAAALQFCLGHPAVAAVIPGARSAMEARDNAALVRASIPAALWSDMRERRLIPQDAPVPR